MLEAQEKARALIGSRVLRESWGERVDLLEPLKDAPGFGSPVSPISLISDRKEGQLRPFFETEWQLAAIRGQARYLGQLFPTLICALGNLGNYTFGTGFGYRAQPKADVDGVAENLVAEIQRIVDQFLEDNDWIGDREIEMHDRCRRDGEMFLSLTPAPRRNRLSVKARFVEPEQITEPQNVREFEEWLCVHVASSWKFGIHTHYRDLEEVYGFHVRWDEDGDDFDYFPAGNVDLAWELHSGLMEHVKLNTDRVIKRGLPDFYAIKEDAKQDAALRKNTAEGATVQAAIAWIEEYTTGIPQGNVEPSILASASDYFDKTTRVGGVHRTYVQDYEAGSIIHTPEGKKHLPGPLGSERNGNFILVNQLLERMLGIRWNMPEYMISGDASNANFASTLVAESPFIKARLRDQQFFKSRIRRILWKVVRLAIHAGVLDRFAGQTDLKNLDQFIELAIEAPDPASRDALQAAQTAQVQQSLGILSRRTAATQAGLDYDQEQTNMQQDGDAAPAALAANPFDQNGRDGLQQPAEPMQAAARTGSDQAPAIEALATGAVPIAQEILRAVNQFRHEAQTGTVYWNQYSGVAWVSFPLGVDAELAAKYETALAAVQGVSSVRLETEATPLSGTGTDEDAANWIVIRPDPSRVAVSESVVGRVVERMVEQVWESYP